MGVSFGTTISSSRPGALRLSSRRSTIPLYAFALGAGITIFTIFRAFSRRSWRLGGGVKILRSPRFKRGDAAATAGAALPYQPDTLPGGRDVDTPYGSIKAYEWGPEHGRKVLLVHGISTPCIALGAVAETLVSHGCRVLLFDLFGRGYSDSPADVAHDARLYISQILLVLASSPLSWTGSNSSTTRFSLLGYSLGGGISAAFTYHFPDLVESLVLVAPSGLVRLEHITWQSKVLYSVGLMPEFFLQWLVRRRMRGGPDWNKHPSTNPSEDAGELKQADSAVSAEVGADEEDSKIARGAPAANPESTAQTSILLQHRRADVAATVSWQVDEHEGFIPAFMSSIRFAPITGQHESWRRIGERLAQRHGKALMILGAKDPVIVVDEVTADVTEVLGKEQLHVEVVDAGHDLPISKSGEVADRILRFWGMH